MTYITKILKWAGLENVSTIFLKLKEATKAKHSLSVIRYTH